MDGRPDQTPEEHVTVHETPAALPVGHPARLAVPVDDVKHLRAVVAALKNDVVAERARNIVNERLMASAADLSGGSCGGGGRALAEYRLNKIADITLELIGQLLVIDEWIERTQKPKGARGQ